MCSHFFCNVIITGSDFLLFGIYIAAWLSLFPFLCLCTLTEDEGLTFLPWLAEGQYYRKRWQSCPILKLWGLIFLKSPVIVFDKSIWEAFRERIRDATWPTSPHPPPHLFSLPLHRRYWTRVLIKRTSKTGTATFSPPSLHRYHHDHPCDRSSSP